MNPVHARGRPAGADGGGGREGTGRPATDTLRAQAPVLAGETDPELLVGGD
jgi:hypothetical protein